MVDSGDKRPMIHISVNRPVSEREVIATREALAPYADVNIGTVVHLMAVPPPQVIVEGLALFFSLPREVFTGALAETLVRLLWPERADSPGSVRIRVVNQERSVTMTAETRDPEELRHALGTFRDIALATLDEATPNLNVQIRRKHDKPRRMK